MDVTAPFPNSLDIRKIDVSQGDDIWVLTTNNSVMYKFNFLPNIFRFVIIFFNVINSSTVGVPFKEYLFSW